jgi:hypothetical protein
MKLEPLRTRCRDPKCRSSLPVAAEFRRAFCSRSCWERFHRTRCRVCGEESPNGRLHVKSCKYLHGQNPTLYAYKRLENPTIRNDTKVEPGTSRNPYKTGIKTRGGTWGPVLSDDEYWIASLPLHVSDAANLKRNNSRARLEPAIGRPKVVFGPDDAPLNLIGGFRFSGSFSAPVTPASTPMPTQSPREAV